MKYPKESRGEIVGGLGGRSFPMIKEGDFSGNFSGYSYSGWAILENFISVALSLWLLAPAKYCEVYGK